MPISTSSATITTNAEMMNPWIIGRMPDFLRLENEVLSPMAANALTISNLLTLFVPDTIAEGKIELEKVLVTFWHRALFLDL